MAVVLLAELTTVLTGDADRMPALFRETSVADDPDFDRAMTLVGAKVRAFLDAVEKAFPDKVFVPPT